MSEPDTNTVLVTARISWSRVQYALKFFLNPAGQLPPTVTDKQLVQLIETCEKTRQRLREKSGG